MLLPMLELARASQNTENKRKEEQDTQIQSHAYALKDVHKKEKRQQKVEKIFVMAYFDFTEPKPLNNKKQLTEIFFQNCEI